MYECFSGMDKISTQYPKPNFNNELDKTGKSNLTLQSNRTCTHNAHNEMRKSEVDIVDYHDFFAWT